MKARNWFELAIIAAITQDMTQSMQINAKDIAIVTTTVE